MSMVCHECRLSYDQFHIQAVHVFFTAVQVDFLIVDYSIYKNNFQQPINMAHVWVTLSRAASCGPHIGLGQSWGLGDHKIQMRPKEQFVTPIG